MPELITVIPPLAWLLFVSALVWYLRSSIRALAAGLAWRVKSGAQMRFGSLELGPAYVSPRGEVKGGKSEVVEEREDRDRARYEERGSYYLPNRDIFLVHRLAPSAEAGQLYDIEMYLVPHKDATLACVQKVEYYFGPHWGDKIFAVRDRASGFRITTSAYGPFVCTAELHFTDGKKAMIWRYVDFEMGHIGK